MCKIPAPVLMFFERLLQGKLIDQATQEHRHILSGQCQVWAMLPWVVDGASLWTLLVAVTRLQFVLRLEISRILGLYEWGVRALG